MKIKEKNDLFMTNEMNEIEIIEFSVGSIVFGIKVMQVREVINAVEVTPSPNSHAFVEGVFQLRNEVLSVVDLAKALHLPPSQHPEEDKFIVAELSDMKVAFHVHTVSRIHRISKEQIDEPSQLSRGLENSTIGIVKLEGRLIMLVDFELVVADILPTLI